MKIETVDQRPYLITMTRPDDWHVHLRDGAALEAVLPYSAAQFGRAIVMPNLKPPVVTTTMALAYRERILAARPKEGPGADFEPLMTLYLTANTPPDEIRRAKAAGIIACKLYPAGATTNSAAGVADMREIYPVLEAMQREGLLLLVHGEVTDPETDIFDREAVFINQVLIPLRKNFPGLKIVLEHITTEDATEYVLACNSRLLGATITAHHLLYNRNALFLGGLRPHYYCLPVLKKEWHRQALVDAATSGAPFFFLGTDSAPHAAELKEQSVCGAGCFTAPAALGLYAEAFEAAGALDKLEGFASLHGPAFYGLPPNKDMVTLIREPWTLPKDMPFGDALIKPLRAGETINWKLV